MRALRLEATSRKRNRPFKNETDRARFRARELRSRTLTPCTVLVPSPRAAGIAERKEWKPNGARDLGSDPFTKS
jgi:hypothetical protein